MPHQQNSLAVVFNKKENFEFICAVLDLKNNKFIKRCTTISSSEGSDGFAMEALEWAFLRPGNYEYRVYIEDTLVAAISFEVISYADHFKQLFKKEVSSYFIKNH